MAIINNQSKTNDVIILVSLDLSEVMGLKDIVENRRNAYAYELVF
jgi:hypothetical protein